MAQEVDELAAVSSNPTKAPDSTSTALKWPCWSFLEETTSIFFFISCLILLLLKDTDMYPIPALISSYPGLVFVH